MPATGKPHESNDDLLSHPLIQAVFNDPRYKHMGHLSDTQDSEPEDVGYDRSLTLQALAAIYSIRSAEAQASSLQRATWALFGATLGLVIATVALVIVTVA